LSRRISAQAPEIAIRRFLRKKRAVREVVRTKIPSSIVQLDFPSKRTLGRTISLAATDYRLYHLPVTDSRIIKSAKPALANRQAASNRNSLRLARIVRALMACRITSRPAATANNTGQSGCSSLTITPRRCSALFVRIVLFVLFQKASDSRQRNTNRTDHQHG